MSKHSIRSQVRKAEGVGLNPSDYEVVRIIVPAWHPMVSDEVETMPDGRRAIRWLIRKK